MKSCLVLITVLVLVSGCSKKPDGDFSSITIQLPDSNHQKSSSVGAMSALPTGRKACYAVSVSGPNIPLSRSAQTCSPELGLVAGFVEAGGQLELQVSRGINRKIDLYLYLAPEGINETCPSLKDGFPVAKMNQYYLLGSASNVSLSKEIETVTINGVFPGVTENLAKQKSYPSSCAPAASPTPTPTPTPPSVSNPTGFEVSLDMQTLTGAGGIILKGTVGRPTDAVELTGSNGIKLKVQ